MDWKTILYLALCGLLLGLSAPGIGAWFLAWLALIPAFLWLRRTESFKQCFQGGLIVGFIFHAVYLCWFTGLHPLTWLGFSPWQSILVTYSAWGLINTLGAFIFGFLFMGYRWLFTKKLDVFLFPILWVFGFSLYSQITEIYIPWALLEYTQAPIPLMRSLSHSFGLGSAIITGLILFHNTALTALIQKHQANKADPYQTLVSVTAIPLLLFLSLVISEPDPSQKPFPFPVAVIQGNLPIGVIRSSPTQSRIAAKNAYIQPLLKAKFPENTLVILPEEGIVSNWVDQANPLSNPDVKTLQDIASQKQWTLALGVSSLKEVDLKTERTTHYHNSILFIQPESPSQFYNKSILVPFGENTPRLHGLLPEQWMETLLESVGVVYYNVFSAGQPQAPIILTDISKNPISVTGLVCFELAYPSFISPNLGDILINTSNLGWFHQHPLLEAQFLAMGQLRAAQANRPLIISANTGISAIINAQGQILKKSPSGKKAQLLLDLSSKQE